ncbi:MAG: tRNA (guanine-N(1)-)-methyltransferase [Parcubacteria group bacterium GW2011_GWC1_42_11]|nr:MAG: tRNA (guanine-N(1)-)-methyltransferase [Parcubacteria group bacterium GW2011_GWC1_42_11]HBH71598.1 tRNA (guanosine(37)-N1)-methyltransferase TrmD [Candidatus Yonathbacteria bacterium]
MIRFHIVTIFPEAVRPYMEASILGRAQEAKHISVSYYDPRELSGNKWGKVDDRPYAGGPGMVMTAEPMLRTLEKIAKSIAKRKIGEKASKVKVIHFAPRGKQFTNVYAKNLVAKYTDIILIAGRYEGIDARVNKIFKGDVVSVGPFVLTGGEVPAMVVVDACARHVEGVLGTYESLEEERTASPEMYTRPEILEWKGKKYRVPKVLLGGDHKKIEEWRKAKITLPQKS